MTKHCRRTRVLYTGSRAIRWCLALGLLAALISVDFASAQGPGTSVNLKGIQCTGGRAASFGVNFNNNGAIIAQAGPVLTALDQSGIGWARVAVQWGWIERKKGVYDWAKIDAGINQLLSVHVTPVIDIMAPTPCWALAHPQKGCTKPEPAIPNKQEWSNFVYATVSRYKDRVHYWEMWNEPNLVQSIDLPDLNQRLAGYRGEILIPGAEAVHSADATAKVIGLVFDADEFKKKQLTDTVKWVLNPPAAELVDIVSYHSYFPGDINGKAIEIRDAMRSLGIGAKPIWLTETGLDPTALGPQRSAAPAYAESRQAGWLQADVLNLLASGNVQRIFWFAMTDSHDFNGAHTDHYGLVDESGPQLKLRPAFLQLKQMIQSACR